MGSPCDSTFFASFGVSLNGNVATFTATSGGQANGYLWDFGDGTQGGGQLVNHVYAPGGPYNACLQAWYWNGTDTCWTAPSCQSIGPFSQNNPCDDLDSTFTFNLVGGSTVVFQPNTFNNQWTYFWEFGDGTSDFGPIITHQYPGPTLFQACLTVWAWDPFTQDTCFATSCQLVDLVGQGDPCDSLGLVADFTWMSQGTVVMFEDLSQSAVQPLSYFWEFGDGGLSTDPDPAHTYPDTASYQVCLWVGAWTGTDSCFAVSCQLVSPGSNGPQAVAGMGSGTTLKVWPNPTNDLLFVELPGTAGPYLVELLDLQGRRIRSRTGVAGLRTQLDLGDLASGFYLVQLRADGLRRTIRVQRQ